MAFYKDRLVSVADSGCTKALVSVRGMQKDKNWSEGLPCYDGSTAKFTLHARYDSRSRRIRMSGLDSDELEGERCRRRLV